MIDAGALGIRRALKQDSTVVSEAEEYDADYDPTLGASMQVSRLLRALFTHPCILSYCLYCLDAEENKLVHESKQQQ